MSEPPDHMIGRYKVTDTLGRGGMGVVYKAWEESLQRHVAIKMLNDRYGQDPEVVERFMREARAIADVAHPNVVNVFLVDQHENRPFFAMEYVRGSPLDRVIGADGKLTPNRAAQILKEVAEGLAAVHDRGVVHRDIKPANIMLTADGRVKLVDFGIARIVDADTKLTRTGMAMGTPSYLSPEMCLAKAIDQRSDIFSLGVVLFEMLAGTVPFKASSPLELMNQLVEANVPDIKQLNPDVDHHLRMILAHMIQKNPDDRYQNCRDLASDLDDFLAGKMPKYASLASSKAELGFLPGQISEASPDAPRQEPVAGPASDIRASQLETAPTPEGPWTRSEGRTQPETRVSGAKSLLVLAVVGGLALVGGAAYLFRPVPSPIVDVPPPHGIDPGEQVAARPAGDDRGGGIPDRAPPPAGHSFVQAEEGGQANDERGGGDQESGTQEETADPNTPDAEPNAPVVDPLAHQAEKASGDANQLGAGEPRGSGSTSEPDSDDEMASSATKRAAIDSPERRTALVAKDQRGPPPVAQWDPSAPRVMVVATGDTALTVVIEDLIEQNLSSDYRVVTKEFVTDPLAVLRGSSPAQASAYARENKVDVVVVVDVTPTAERLLQYYGRQSVQVTAQVRARTLSLHAPGAFGKNWSRTVEYTEFNSQESAAEAAAEMTAVIRRNLAGLAG